MSPARARTSGDEIVAAARDLLEADGLDGLTMAGVAARVGVRAPSLYKRLRDRAALVAAVAVDAADELGQVLSAADPGPGAASIDRLTAVAVAYRAFARRSPRAVALLFGDPTAAADPPLDAARSAARPILEIAAAIAGPDRALDAARVLTAFVHGFTAMESAGAFRLGGDPDAALRLGIAALARGLVSAG